jgi:glycosyltransferase involved in cell wall biosynthesis
MRRRIVLAANSSWNIVNFRSGLIRALKDADYDPIVVAPTDSASDERLKALAVQHVTVRIDRAGVYPVADLRLLWTYRLLLKQLRADAFLGYTIKPNIYGTIAARSLNIAAIPNVSGLGTAFIGRGPLEIIVTGLYRVAFRGLQTVFFQNSDDRALFVGKGIVEPAHAKLIPGSGIDAGQFPVTPLPTGPTTFLLVARLLGDKGVREYVQAARLLRTEFPEARFQLLGPLDERNRTAISKRELDEWIAEGAVEYLGETADVRPFVARSTAVVLPSYREGMPRSLLEGAAMGRPLVATDVPGCREIAQEGRTGFLCSVRDAASLADAMRRMIIVSADERQAMGDAARARVEREFSEGLVIRAYLDALEKIERARS